jgi:hypothetical protein
VIHSRHPAHVDLTQNPRYSPFLGQDAVVVELRGDVFVQVFHREARVRGCGHDLTERVWDSIDPGAGIVRPGSAWVPVTISAVGLAVTVRLGTRIPKGATQRERALSGAHPARR